MKKHLLITFVILLSGCPVHAQFSEGYIISNGNDTIHGYINSEGSIKNSDNCAFSHSADARTVQLFKPGEIKGFRFIEGKYFTSAEIPFEGQSRQVFLEWLIKGKSSLLTYSPSALNVRYFLLAEDGSLVELFNTNSRSEYKSILTYYFKDCPSLKPKIENLSFTSRSLMNITKEYHERTCDTWDCIVYEDKNRKLDLNFGVTAGFFSSRMLMKTDKPEGIFSPPSPEYGLMITAQNLPLLSPKFSLKMNVMFQNSSFRFDTAMLASANPVAMSQLIGKNNQLFRVKFIRVPVMLKYRLTSGRINPYLSLGATVNFRYSYDRYNQRLLDYIFENEGFAYNSIKLVQLGVNSGAGLQFDFIPKISLDLGYDFEYWFRFFSSSANERSLNKNHFLYISTIYRF